MFLSVTLQAISKSNTMSNANNDTPYGIMGFDEDMRITSCNPIMEQLISSNTKDFGCVDTPVLEALDVLEKSLISSGVSAKVVIVVSEKCSHHLRNGYVSSALFTTLVDDTGMVQGGTIVVRKKD